MSIIAIIFAVMFFSCCKQPTEQSERVLQNSDKSTPTNLVLKPNEVFIYTQFNGNSLNICTMDTVTKTVYMHYVENYQYDLSIRPEKPYAKSPTAIYGGTKVERPDTGYNVTDSIQ